MRFSLVMWVEDLFDAYAQPSYRYAGPQCCLEKLLLLPRTDGAVITSGQLFTRPGPQGAIQRAADAAVSQMVGFFFHLFYQFEEKIEINDRLISRAVTSEYEQTRLDIKKIVFHYFGVWHEKCADTGVIVQCWETELLWADQRESFTHFFCSCVGCGFETVQCWECWELIIMV